MAERILLAVLRTVFIYFALLLLIRIMGRKLISQMNFFDFVAGITMGTLTAEFAMNLNGHPEVPATALFIIFLLSLAIEFMDLKSFSFRKLVNSTPVLVIENGSILDKNMKKLRFTVDELMMHLREKDIFSVADVEFAVLEVDGKLSVLPKSQKQPLTPADLKMSTKYVGLTKDLVIDGKILESSLKEVSLDEKWLYEQLHKQDIENIKDVFYAGLDTSGNLYVSRRS